MRPEFPALDPLPRPSADERPPIFRYFDAGGMISVSLAQASELSKIYESFYDLAAHLVETTPSGAEQTAGLRKLLEARECFIRAVMP